MSERRLHLVANQGAMGGGEVMLLAMARAARKAGIAVTVVAPDYPSGTLHAAAAEGFATVAVRSPSARGYLVNLRRWAVQRGSGVLWCNGLRPAVATAGLPGRVVHLHQLPAGAHAAATLLATRGARVVVPSRFVQRAVPGSEVLPNWTEEIPLAPVRERDGRVVVGYLGRLDPGKGVHDLLAAMERLQRDRPARYELLLAGESRYGSPEEQAALESAVAAASVPVVRPGWMAPADFFAAVDVAAFPSTLPESFGLVAAEAMAAGRPFVVTRTGALPEVVGEGFPWLAEPGDPGSLAAALVRALDADSTAERQRLRARWEAEFSPRAGEARFLDHLARCGLGPAPQSPRVALAHDYLTQRGGAERVALAMTEAFPGAPLFTSLYDPDGTYPEFGRIDVRTSPLDRLRWLRRHFRAALPLFGWAFDHHPVPDEYDVVLASTTGFAHGIPTRGRKVVYCHSPARFLYLADEYLGRSWWRTPKGLLLHLLRPALIRWDQRAARSADVYLCNSTVVQERIRRVYGIEAQVVPPPASLDATGPQEDVPELDGWDSYHLVVSRLLPYKNVDQAIAAFRELPQEHLLVVGRGPERDRLAAQLPSNVRLAEGLPDAQLRRAYAGAASVIAPSFEDFGLTPIEGYTFGVPTLALRAGGYLDTVVDGETGYYFDEPTAEAIAAAVRRLRDEPLAPRALAERAQRFTPDAFAATLRRVVEGTHHQ